MISARPVFSEKGKGLFLFGSALQVFGAVWRGEMRTRFCQNYFLGKIGKTGILFCICPRGGGSEEGTCGAPIFILTIMIKCRNMEKPHFEAQFGQTKKTLESHEGKSVEFLKQETLMNGDGVRLTAFCNWLERIST